MNLKVSQNVDNQILTEFSYLNEQLIKKGIILRYFFFKNSYWN